MAVPDPCETRYSFGIRHIQMALLFSCMATIYVSRVNLSIAIIGMTKPDYETDAPVFKWSEHTKGTILSSFFWGYLVSNVPAAILTHRFDNKVLMAVVMAANTIMCVFSPLVIMQFGSAYFVALRVGQGLCQGFIMPTILSLLSKWAPPTERARAGAFIIGGMNFGVAVTMFSSGYIMSTKTGWPLIYYITAILGLCWLILWMLLAADSPDSHKSITEEERNYIKLTIVGRTQEQRRLNIPWRSLLTSVPVWAIIIAHLGNNWGMWTILTEIPTFINAALDFDVKSDGLLSSLPYFLMWISSFPLSIIADKLIKTNVMSIEFSRKFWNHMGQSVTGILLILLPFSAEFGSPAIAITVYTIAIIFNSCISFGFAINHMDISPNFSCILMGLSNGAANITSIVGPLFAGFTIKDEKNIKDWRFVFIMSGWFYIIGSTIFSIFGSGTVQPWNNLDESLQCKTHLERKISIGNPPDSDAIVIVEKPSPVESRKIVNSVKL